MHPQREKSPNMRLRPIKVRPHIFRVSTVPRILGLVTIHFANPENIHLESNKYAADVQLAFDNFAIPSYNKCQPISNLSNDKLTN